MFLKILRHSQTFWGCNVAFCSVSWALSCSERFLKVVRLSLTFLSVLECSPAISFVFPCSTCIQVQDFQKKYRTCVETEPTPSHPRCDALRIGLISAWEQGGGEKGHIIQVLVLGAYYFTEK